MDGWSSLKHRVGRKPGDLWRVRPTSARSGPLERGRLWPVHVLLTSRTFSLLQLHPFMRNSRRETMVAMSEPLNRVSERGLKGVCEHRLAAAN